MATANSTKPTIAQALETIGIFLEQLTPEGRRRAGICLNVLSEAPYSPEVVTAMLECVIRTHEQTKRYPFRLIAGGAA